MGETLIQFIFLSFCLLTFEFNFCTSGANRAYYGLLKSVAEASVVAYDENGEDTSPYYLVDEFEEYVNDYLRINMKPYVTSYKASYSYENEGGLAAGKYNVVTLVVDCKISHWIEFKKGNSFHIERNGK